MNLKRAGLTAALTIGLLTIGVGAAQAADSPAEQLVTAALASEGIALTDGDLTTSLTDTVQAALDAGIVSDTIVGAINDPAVTDPAATDTPAPEATLDPELDQLITDHAAGEFARWDDIGPQIQAAFDAVRAQFADCRATGSVSDCARTLGLQFQVALAEVKISALQTQIDAAAALPAEQQADAIAALQEAQAAIAAKLADTQAKLIARTGATDEAAAAQASALSARYTLPAQANGAGAAAKSGANGTESSTPSESSAPGNSGNANSNSNGKSNSSNGSSNSSNGKSNSSNGKSNSSNGNGKN